MDVRVYYSTMLAQEQLTTGAVMVVDPVPEYLAVRFHPDALTDGATQGEFGLADPAMIYTVDMCERETTKPFDSPNS